VSRFLIEDVKSLKHKPQTTDTIWLRNMAWTFEIKVADKIIKVCELTTLNTVRYNIKHFFRTCTGMLLLNILILFQGKNTKAVEVLLMCDMLKVKFIGEDGENLFHSYPYK
jgi:hypothetical protein